MGTVREIEFHGDRSLGIEAEGGAYVYLKPIVERMGLDWSAQPSGQARSDPRRGCCHHGNTP